MHGMGSIENPPKHGERHVTFVSQSSL
jgi:hypothetical protein